MGEITTQVQSLVITGLGLFAVAVIGIIVTTWLQEMIRTRMRNGRGNVRSNDNGWPKELIRGINGMNERLNRLDATMDRLHKCIDETKEILRKGGVFR